MTEQIEETAPAGAYGLERSYRRRANVEAEIRALPADPGALPGALAQAAACETVVHGIRRLVRAGRDGAVQDACALLIARCTPLLAAIARSQPVAPGEHEDLVQAATLQMWQEVCDLAAQHEFWEVHFNYMLRIACRDAAERLRRQRRHERPFRRRETDDGELWDEADTLVDPTAGEPALIVPEALAQLDGNVRRAFWLKTQGYKERSKDASEPTISSLLGVSDRTVRNYLRSAEEILRPWIEQGRLESEQMQA